MVPGGRLPAAVERHGLGLLLALATLGVLSWDLTRPALWLDESASALATQRSWPNLRLLLHGSDAPLVPYYALLKVLTTATRNLFPAAGAHLELLYRWPSVAATVLAVWVLAVWLARRSSAGVVLGAGVFLLASAGVSRYGQEARPYAVVLLAAVVSTVLLTRLIEVGRNRWAVLYGLAYAAAIVVLIAANTLAGALIAGHLVAALTAGERGRRWWSLLRAAIAAGIGVAVVAHQALTASANGGGATQYATFTGHNLYLTFVHVFSSGGHPVVWVGGLIPLALLGLATLNSERYWVVARVAAACALVPTLLMLPAVIERPNLLIGRYLLFTLPFWGVLGGLGVVTLYRLLCSAVRVRAVAGLLTVGLLAAVVVSQVSTLTQPRAPGGHGEDIRPALAAANLPQNAQLPLFVATVRGSVEIGAYDRAIEGRMLSVLVQRDEPPIWPDTEPPQLRKARLLSAPRILLMMRVSPLPGCGADQLGASAAAIDHCMPPMLQHLGYQVESFEPSGHEWAFAVLDRVVTPTPTGLTSQNFVRR